MAEKLDCFGPLLHRPGMQFRGAKTHLRQHKRAKCCGVAKKSLEQKHLHRWSLWYSTTQVAGLETASYCLSMFIFSLYMFEPSSKCCIFVDNICRDLPCAIRKRLRSHPSRAHGGAESKGPNQTLCALALWRASKRSMNVSALFIIILYNHDQVYVYVIICM